jgi:hypothetical protein
LLANIALHVIDEAWAKAAGLGTLVRYADDFVVLTTSRSRAEEAKRRIEAVAGRPRLATASRQDPNRFHW